MTSLNLEAEGPINTTAHEVRQRARCNNCGVKGNNTYQIVYRKRLMVKNFDICQIPVNHLRINT